MKLSTAQRFRNADSYACLAYLLARETAEALRSRVLREKGETPPAAAPSPLATLRSELPRICRAYRPGGYGARTVVR
jgi:hypothetical protein